LVQIWSVATNPWKLRRTLTTSSNGKIRSLSWHSNTLFLAAAGIDFGVLVWDVNHNWNTTIMETRSPMLPPPPHDSYVHYVDWSPLPMGSTRHSFVVDTTIYEMAPVTNIFAESDLPASARAIAVLDACRLCTLPQWSPDGQTIATAFGTSISISQVQRDDVNTNDTDPAQERWEMIRNITTVNGTYMVISVMEWSPNGNYLAVGGAGQALLFLYDSTNWTAPPITFETLSDVDTLAWRPDGTHIAVGTDRRIEILEIQAPIPRPSPPTAISSDSFPPARAPSIGALPTPLTLDSGLRIGSMTGIGIAAIAISFTIVGIVFCQRMKLVRKRKRRKQVVRDHNDAIREVDITASEGYCDHPSFLSMNHRITSDSVAPLNDDDCWYNDRSTIDGQTNSPF
jgi:WD40 repeat protein